MQNQLAKPQHCILLKNGIQIWIDDQKLPIVDAILGDKTKDFILIEGERIGRYEISGIFSPQGMESITRKNNGEWQCHKGTWHEKGHQCSCKPQKTVTAHVEGIGEIEYKSDK